MACPSFIPARQPVQSSNQSNPILDFYPLSELEKGQARLGGRQLLPVCLPALMFGLSSKAADPPPPPPPLFFTFFFLRCSAHSGLSPIQANIPVTDVVEELYGTGIKLWFIYLRLKLDQRLKPVMWFDCPEFTPIVLHSSALVPNGAMSPMTTLIHIDL